ncbi:MAG: CusA/CzcA family heavy metal efflux RND transporter [Planctomycetota bacterium]|nr:CusA/CzcA family heavy metal efflux RND transporter [Planctomycetota bacterium]
MLERVARIAVEARALVVLAAVGVIVFGIYAYDRMPVDAFPDISPIMVPVFAEAHGMAPEEIERLITYPIEAAMNGLPGITQVKSTSAFGLAVIYIYFRDDVDIYFARQLVGQRLASVMDDLPEMHDPPVLGPISTGLGQIFLYYLTLDPGTDTHGKDPNTYLREVNDWVVKFQLQTVPGVTDILSIGGHVLQYQIRVDPNALSKYRLSLEDLVDAVRHNNRNAGGQFLVMGAEEHLVRGIGLLSRLDEIRSIPIEVEDGVAITVGDVAEVAYGNEIRRGVVTRNGEREVVSGLVLKLFGENTSGVIENLYDKVTEVQRSLPPGVNLIPYYEQAELVQDATSTVKNALLMGAGLVVLTLVVFLGNLRTAFIVALALPLCALVAVIGMAWNGISANLMSLGGIAIGIGMLGDGAIVMVENIYRHLGRDDKRTKADRIIDAAKEVSRPIVFSITIIVLVFLPIFTLEGVEGKMFTPMAFTISFALLGSILAALVVAPALSHYLLRTGAHKELFLVRMLKAAYRPALRFSLRHKAVILVGSLIAFALSMLILPYLGTEFIPTLEEGSILIGVTMAPSTSLAKGTEIVMRMERQILQFPEVKQTISRIGRPEAGSHPHPVNYAEVHIELEPLEEWTRYRDKQELVEALNRKLSSYPGVQLNFTQPIQNAFDELLSGIRAQLAIKLFGEDLGVLREKAGEVRAAIEDVPGLVDLAVEQSFGQPQVQIVADREACSRYGVTVGQILELVEMAIGGEVIDNLYLGTRRFGIHVRYKEPYRVDPASIRDLLVHTHDGSLIPLSQVAAVKQVLGPIQVNREKNQRRWIVQGNVRGRDLGSVVADIRSRIDERVDLPPGYFIEYGGQFENQQRAMARLSIIVPIVIAAVLIMLWIAFGTARHALIIIVNVPLALIGGIFGLLITGEYLSVPASVGFIALFGIAVQNGVVLVSYFNQLLREGKDVQAAIEEGALRRLRPVLMTAITTVLGLLPLLLATGIGSDVQRPLATVVVFGLVTSTLLTLIVIPAAYGWIEGRRHRASASV